MGEKGQGERSFLYRQLLGVLFLWGKLSSGQSDWRAVSSIR